MFAAPNPTVVSENVELLLKIGLGPHGKVRGSSPEPPLAS